MKNKIGLYLIYKDAKSVAYKDTWSYLDGMYYADKNPHFYGDYLYRVNVNEEPKHSILATQNITTIPALLILEIDEGAMTQKVVGKLEGADVNYASIEKTVETNITLLKSNATLPAVSSIKKSELTGKTVKFLGAVVPKWVKIAAVSAGAIFTFILGLFILKKMYASLKS